MLRLFGHAVSIPVLALAAAEALLVYAALGVVTLIAPFATPEMTWLPMVFILAAMLGLGVYEPAARANFGVMTERLGVACLLGAAAAFFMLYIFGNSWVSPLFAVAAAAFPYGFIVVARLAARHAGDVSTFQRRVMILGGGETAAAAAGLLIRPSVAARLAGFTALDEAEAPGALLDAARAGDVTEIVVAVDDRRADLPWRALLDCKMAGIHIVDYVAFHEHETGKVDPNNIYPARLIFSDSFGHSRWSLRAKRAMDVGVSFLGLAVLSPLLLLTALAVSTTSPGGAFYRQTRVGLGGRAFDILKFRSMRADAEKHGAQWAQAGDPRVTRIGRFIRKTRIDELPQLWNILKGDMSLVGPRPERPVFVAELTAKLPYYQDRHRVKPGLTGWAQINYPYGASDEDAREKLTYDLYYMKNCSLFLDVLIMLKTARVVLWGDGAR